VVLLPPRRVLNYKVTLGSWRFVEKGPQGEEIVPRALVLDRGQVVSLEVARWADGQRSSMASTRWGDIRTHENFPSMSLGNTRSIDVYLPPDYEEDADARYPVLYLHDGQNVFDATTASFGVEWRADETAERLIREKKIRPVILVAIAGAPNRIDEYTSFADPKHGLGGKGDLYAKFVVEELKPFIDATYRTRPGRADTGVAGSSLGGLISLRIAERYPDRVSMCGILSPTLWWAGDRVLNDLDAPAAGDWLHGTRFWLDIGTREGSRPNELSPELPRTRRLAARFTAAGLQPEHDFRYREIPDGEHDEAAWSLRFGDVLTFFFAPDAESPGA
jgi:predicted alpha/beta superfamily hydrolase